MYNNELKFLKEYKELCEDYGVVLKGDMIIPFDEKVMDKLNEKYPNPTFKITIKYKNDYFPAEEYICSDNYFFKSQICHINFVEDIISFQGFYADNKGYDDLELDRIYTCFHDTFVMIECYIKVKKE